MSSEKFKDSKFVHFLNEKVKPIAGDIITAVGDVTGIGAIERAGELINKGAERNEELKQVAIDFERFKLDFAKEMEQINNDFYIAELDALNLDRENSRQREINIMRESKGKRDWLMGVVVITGLVMTVGVVACLVFVKIPVENQRLADMSFGTVLGIGTSIFSYYVGSSRSSWHKDKTIENISK